MNEQLHLMDLLAPLPPTIGMGLAPQFTPVNIRPGYSSYRW